MPFLCQKLCHIFFIFSFNAELGLPIEYISVPDSLFSCLLACLSGLEGILCVFYIEGFFCWCSRNSQNDLL